MARDDLSSVHRQRHDLNGEVPSEEGARRIPGRAPEHPVDDAKSDERRTRTARDRDTCVRPETARIDAGKRRSRVPKRSDCTAETLRARRGLNGANYQQIEQSRVRVRPVMLKEAGWFESEPVLTTLLS